MDENFITNEEILYRCVFYERNCYQIVDNTAKVTSQAFTDRKRQPSVDRACLCNYEPSYTQRNDQDAVVSLITEKVRLIDEVVQNDPKGNREFTYKIDVIYRPLDENVAHAQIEPSPEYRNQKPFRKLLERLANLAKWEIPPYELIQ